MMKNNFTNTIFFLTIIIFSCSKKENPEVRVINLPLQGVVTDKNQEISGMDWFNDYLIMLPENLNGYLFSIPKEKIMKSILSDLKSPILPDIIKFNTPNYKETIPGFDSFESIAFRGFEVFITIEIKFPDSMSAKLVRGHIDAKTMEVTIPEQNFIDLKTPSFIENMSYESILIDNNNVYTFFEANGNRVNPNPFFYLTSLNSMNTSKFEFPNIEYRITDATRIDVNNNFWMINYYYPGDVKDLQPDSDYLENKYILGESHKKSKRVERLVQFKIQDNEINITETLPIQLELDDGEVSRKWEALCRIDNIGFLIATDKYPTTLLGYIPLK